MYREARVFEKIVLFPRYLASYKPFYSFICNELLSGRIFFGTNILTRITHRVEKFLFMNRRYNHLY